MKLIYFGKNRHKSNIFSEPLILNNLVDKLKILGVHWNEKLSWRDHFDYVIAKCNSRLHAINVTKRLLNYDELWLLFHSTVVSLIEYAAPYLVSLRKVFFKIFALYISVVPKLCVKGIVLVRILQLTYRFSEIVSDSNSWHKPKEKLLIL